MPDSRLTRTRDTLPSGYQFGDLRALGFVWSCDLLTTGEERRVPWTVADQRAYARRLGGWSDTEIDRDIDAALARRNARTDSC